MTATYRWRGRFDNAELNALHAEAWLVDSTPTTTGGPMLTYGPAR
ncbi:MAG TPA: hypothetical protein VLE71_05665 [Actinomycetota bacterium]|nr:hypothetical protein [Actinomycetota bacterium]